MAGLPSMGFVPALQRYQIRLREVGPVDSSPLPWATGACGWRLRSAFGACGWRLRRAFFACGCQLRGAFALAAARCFLRLWRAAKLVDNCLFLS